MEGPLSSKADAEPHPQWLFPFLAEPPKLGRGTGSPEDEEWREGEGEEKEVPPGEGGTPPTLGRRPWGGGEEPRPTRSCLLPLGGVPLPPKLNLSGVEGSFCRLEIGSDRRLCPVPPSGYREVGGTSSPLLEAWKPSRLLSLGCPLLLNVSSPRPREHGLGGRVPTPEAYPLLSAPPKVQNCGVCVGRSGGTRGCSLASSVRITPLLWGLHSRDGAGILLASRKERLAP